jgi:uncharacterized protein (DUF927 family)
MTNPNRATKPPALTHKRSDDTPPPKDNEAQARNSESRIVDYHVSESWQHIGTDDAEADMKANSTFIPENFEVREGKLYHLTDTASDAKYHFVSDAFQYIGRCHDENGKGWAHVIEWTDLTGNLHKGRIPLSELGLEQSGLFKKLRDEGLTCGETKEAKESFKTYLRQQRFHRIIQTTNKPGWFRGTYIMRNGTKFGEGDVALEWDAPHNATSGSLREWQDNVARFAIGNPHIAFSMCAVLAGPLLESSGANGGGFHFFGKSQSGKTSALVVAASIIADSQWIRTWKSTGNGLEALAASFNDSTLLLDEIGEMPEKQSPGELTYMLGNGHGKERMTSSTKSGDSKTWRLLYLSSGEHDLSSEAAIKRKKLKAGQLVRHADIPLIGLGIKELHGFECGRALIDHMRASAKRYYGTAAREFLTKLVELRANQELSLRETLDQLLKDFVSDVGVSAADPQVVSVARRFALAGVAGKLATEWKILPWDRDEAWEAAKACFAAFLDHRGHQGAHENEQAIQIVRAFIQSCQDSRFKKLGEKRVVHNCAGIIKDDKFLVFPHVFQDEICKGNDAKIFSNSLLDAGFLEKDKEKNFAKKRAWMGSTKGFM